MSYREAAIEAKFFCNCDASSETIRQKTRKYWQLVSEKHRNFSLQQNIHSSLESYLYRPRAMTAKKQLTDDYEGGCGKLVLWLIRTAHALALVIIQPKIHLNQIVSLVHFCGAMTDETGFYESYIYPQAKIISEEIQQVISV
jgi:hypothetical protein